MDGERDKKPEGEEQRRPYSPPAILEEQEFERHALQACDKLPAAPQCTEFPATANLS
jgi:hypothetical protein